jgi:hypothetical protein
MTRGAVCAGVVLLATIVVAAERDVLHPAPTSGAVAPGAAAVPTLPDRLADTGLYDASRFGEVDPRNSPFAPQYPLWSDGLLKRRWVYIPPGTTIDTTDEQAWQFPVGTKFWKEFSLGDRKVETRLLWRQAGGDWSFATYVWNEDGTDAVLAPEAGLRNVVEVAPGRRHSIPSRTDCQACHGTTRVAPLGFNALQLSTDRDPNALHAEPLRADMLTLETLQRSGRLSPSRPDYLTSPPRIPTANPETRAVLGYLAANCGVCHNGQADIAGFDASVAYRDVLTDADAVVRRLTGTPTRWQVPGLPEGSSVLVKPGDPAASAILARMRSRSPSSQMPALGTVVRDEAAVNAVARWIDTELARVH